MKVYKCSIDNPKYDGMSAAYIQRCDEPVLIKAEMVLRSDHEAALAEKDKEIDELRRAPCEFRKRCVADGEQLLEYEKLGLQVYGRKIEALNKTIKSLQLEVKMLREQRNNAVGDYTEHVDAHLHATANYDCREEAKLICKNMDALIESEKGKLK